MLSGCGYAVVFLVIRFEQKSGSFFRASGLIYHKLIARRRTCDDDGEFIMLGENYGQLVSRILLVDFVK